MLGCARNEIPGVGCDSQVWAPLAVQAAAVSQLCGQSLVGQDLGCNFGWGVGSSPAPLTQLQHGWDSPGLFLSTPESAEDMSAWGFDLEPLQDAVGPGAAPQCAGGMGLCISQSHGCPLFAEPSAGASPHIWLLWKENQGWCLLSISVAGGGMFSHPLLWGSGSEGLEQHCLFRKNEAALWLNELKSFKNK